MTDFNHIRVRKSYSRDTIMVSPVDDQGADRWADAANPGVMRAVASATIVDDECNGCMPPDHPAAAGLLNNLSHIKVLRRGPEMSGGLEPRPSLPTRIHASTLVRFIDLTAHNSDDPELFWRTRPIASLLTRPQGATRMILNTSFDPRHPRLRETSITSYFIGQSEVTLIFTPYERVQSSPPVLNNGDLLTPASAPGTPVGTPQGSPRTSTDKIERPGYISSKVAPTDRHLGMINDLVYAMSECFGGTTCKFTLVGVDSIPAWALNLPDDYATDWPKRREAVRHLIGMQVTFTRSVYPPQPPIPGEELNALLNDIKILTREEYRTQVGDYDFDLLTVW